MKLKKNIRHKKLRLNRSAGGNIAINILLCFMGIFMILPMVYAISNSLKPLNELWIYPPKFFVENPTLSNFRNLFNMMNDSWVPFSRYLANTVFISVVGTLGHVFLSSLCAYALAKHDFPGKNILFKMVVFSLMFSTVVTAVPNFLIMAKLHLIDTHWSIILPAFASSLGLYLMKQFMEANIPDTLIEAAHIDGASEGTVFFRIVMPLVKPAWLTLALFAFRDMWTITGSGTIFTESMKTLPEITSTIASGGLARSGSAMAMSVIMMIPPIIVYLISQSSVKETMSTSGIK